MDDKEDIVKSIDDLREMTLKEAHAEIYGSNVKTRLTYGIFKILIIIARILAKKL